MIVIKKIILISAVIVMLLCISCKTTEQKHEKTSTDVSKKQENDFNVFDYIKYVLNPTLEGIDKDVVLESDKIKITLQRDMAFQWLDKKTGQVKVGRFGFNMEISGKNPRCYYLFLNSLDEMSKDDFLDNSNYKETSDIIFEPIAASKEQVTYKYLKPADKSEETITFSIIVLN